MLAEPVRAPVGLITAPLRHLDTPFFDHLEPFSVPDVRLHPRPVPFLSQLKLVEEEAQLAPVSSAPRATQCFALRGNHLFESPHPHSKRHAVVIVSHGATPHVSGQQLVLELVRLLVSQKLSKMLKFKRASTYEIVKVDKLGHLGCRKLVVVVASLFDLLPLTCH